MYTILFINFNYYFNTLQDLLKCRVNDERPTRKKTTSEWDDGGKIDSKNK